MPIFLQLSLTAIVPVLVSVGLYMLDKKTKFSKLNNKLKQLIFGVIFGGLAVMATEIGVDVGGATANVRDASVLIAGLLFGAPAGIIAGVIGGVERFFAVYWGAGEFTRWACSISTILAGVIGAVLRRYMFDDKKPTTLYSFGIGIVTEVLHLLMIFVTNAYDLTKAFNLIETVGPSMILVNGISVMLSVFIIRIIAKEIDFKSTKKKQITSVFSRWLLLCVVFAFSVTSLFTFFLQYRISNKEAEDLLRLNIRDVQEDIMDASDENMLLLTHKVAERVTPTTTISDLEGIIDYFEEQGQSITGISIIDPDGIIRRSTNPNFVNFDMDTDDNPNDGKPSQSQEFLVLLGDTTEYVQAYQPTASDPTISRKFAGVKLDFGGFVQIGYDAVAFQKDIKTQVVGATRNRHVGQSGCIIIAGEDWNIVSDRNNNEGKNLDVTGIWIDLPTMPQGEVFYEDVYGEPCRFMYYVTEGFYIVAVYPESEAVFTRNLSIYTSVFMEILVFVGLFILIYFLIKKLVVNNIKKVNDKLSEITGGNLDVTVDVRDNEEFASLSDDINSTVDTLKHYIDMAAARIDAELEFAKSIQHSSLPSVFPPYPNRTDFDLFARMDTAKEVGGDFYDFYMTGDDELIFMVADVSGKGIPAAMFMMRAKTLIKSLVESGLDLDEVFIKANDNLCENNGGEMFVTAWLGKIDLTTGVVTFVNAGHNPPILKRKNGEAEFLKSKAGLVLAGMSGILYRKNQVTLEKGDTLYLYTDGVTEATDAENQLFGEPRLKEILDNSEGMTSEQICNKVMDGINEFVKDAPQFDDITMLSVKYLGFDKE